MSSFKDTDGVIEFNENRGCIEMSDYVRYFEGTEFV